MEQSAGAVQATCQPFGEGRRPRRAGLFPFFLI